MVSTSTWPGDLASAAVQSEQTTILLAFLNVVQVVLLAHISARGKRVRSGDLTVQRKRDLPGVHTDKAPPADDL